MKIKIFSFYWFVWFFFLSNYWQQNIAENYVKFVQLFLQKQICNNKINMHDNASYQLKVFISRNHNNHSFYNLLRVIIFIYKLLCLFKAISITKKIVVKEKRNHDFNYNFNMICWIISKIMFGTLFLIKN